MKAERPLTMRMERLKKPGMRRLPVEMRNHFDRMPRTRMGAG